MGPKISCFELGILFVLLAGLAESKNVTLAYTEAGSSLFNQSASVSGCYASFGAYPHWCLGNVTSCLANGFSVAFWFKPQPANVTADNVTIITSGGTTANSEGFYVKRSYGDQYEVGVARAGRLWRRSVQLRTLNSWVHLVLAWTEGTGLKVGVDGVYGVAASGYENRSYVPDSDLRALEVGLDGYGDPVTSPCSFDVQHVDVLDSAAATLSVGPDPGFDKNLIEGCVATATLTDHNTTDVTAQTNPARSCRQRCYDNGYSLALLRNNSTCSCNSSLALLDLLLPACVAGSWMVYRVHHVTTTSDLTLRAWSQQLSGRAYTKPGEDVRFLATLDLSVDATFNFTFDDGVTLLTSVPPVHHAFAAAGSHRVKVTASLGVVQVSASLSVDIQDVDEGKAPSLVALTSYHEATPRTAVHCVTVVDEHPVNCSFRLGDGTKENLPLIQIFGAIQRANHTYDVCGRFYSVVDCSNAYGVTSDNFFFTARDLDTFSSYLSYGSNFTVPVAGSVNFLKSVQMLVNGIAVDHDFGQNSVTASSSSFTAGVDNIVDVKINDTLVTRHVVRSERRLSQPAVLAEPAYSAWSLTANVSVTAAPCDYATLTVDFGLIDPPSAFFIQEATDDVVYWQTVNYTSVGAYFVSAALYNDVTMTSDDMWVSVEVPIERFTAAAANVTSLSDPVLLTLDLNKGTSAPDRVVFTVDYGDGTDPQISFHTNDGNTFQPVTLRYKYSDWGIYNIFVNASNNITSLSQNLVVQVGNNITYVDITTGTERVPLSNYVNFTVTCPTGSDVLYILNFGDGTTLSVNENNKQTIGPNSVAEVTSPSAVTVRHLYTSPGYYRVNVTAQNAFSQTTATLCPTVVVDNSGVTSGACTPPTVTLSAPYNATSLQAPVITKRSAEVIIQVKASVNCPINVTTVNYSWKAFLVTKDAKGKVTEATVQDVCLFQVSNNTLVLPPRALQFGLYRLSVTVAPSGFDLITSYKDVFLQIVQSEPVSIIDGGNVKTIMAYATAILDISQSNDPDLDTNVRKDLTFYLFCMPEASIRAAANLTLEAISSVSRILSNRTVFRTTTMNELWLFEYQPCFTDRQQLTGDLTVYNGKISFPASCFLTQYYSFAMVLWTERNGLSSKTSQIVEVLKTNTTLSDLGSLLDIALNADPDTAIRLIGGAAAAILGADSSSADDQERLAKSAEAVVSTLGSVAKRVDNANQATKCASTIKTMTSNKDIVTQGSRGSAADAFLSLTNATSSMEDATVEDASSLAAETLGGLDNIFPASVTETKVSPRQAASVAAAPESTTVAEILAARNVTLDATSTTPFVPTASTTTTKATTPPPMAATTTTRVTLTIPPSSSVGSFVFNGSNYIISGITISTLAVSSGTAATTAMTTTRTTTTTAESVVTADPSVSDWMLEPRTEDQSPYEVAGRRLTELPLNPTYDELFSYIFNDCLLFRKVMKEDAVQNNFPCMTSADVNLMKCEGEASLQDRVFEVMTYLEHPDDIYEVYLKPLNAERQSRDELRRQTDAQVAGAGNTALNLVANTVGSKVEDTTERTFETQRFAMKLQKVNVAEGSNSTNSSGVSDSSKKQSMATAVGSFSMPTNVLAGVGDCPSLNSMFLGDSDNPYTYSEQQSSVGKGVMSLGYSCGDQKVQVQDTSEPIELWMERDAAKYQPGLFVLLTDVSNKNAQFNYHPVNLTDYNSSLQIIVRPQGENEAFEVYVQYNSHPNMTSYDFKDYVPKADLSHLSYMPSLETLAPEIKDDLLYTVTVPTNLTRENGTYWIGIKLLRGTVSIDDSLSNTSYTLINLVSGCRFWDETNSSWSSEGCEVGELTSRWKTQCLCTHLTSFGSDAVVPPNTIDFTNVWAKFNNLGENAAVFSTIISLIGLYIIMVIWARYMDKKDLIKWGAIPLEDNLPSDKYHYQLAVYTGIRKNAGTDSLVRFILSGDEADTGARRLFDGKRKHLARSSIFNYILSVEEPLGALTFMRIWHDNSGKGQNKSWYLDQVQVTDLQTNERWYFLCDRWLAVEEDDGMVDRIIPVAGINELIAFKHLFSSSARKKLANDHLWFSVFSRPTRSSFTRVQRISCCMSLLFLTMITNAMWFKTEGQQGQTTGIRMGPFQFTLGQVFISFMSTLIVFPVNFLLVLLFRRCRPRKNTVMQVNQSMTGNSQKYRWKSVSTASTSALWGKQAKKSGFQKFKESLTEILSFHQKKRYEEEEEPHEMENAEDRRLGQRDVDGRSKRKKPWSFPHWCIYIAWALCILSILTSGFFTILYSMEWGAQKANDWLVTFLLSFFQSVIVVQPVKVLLMVALIACIFKKPDLDEEVVNEDLDKVLSPEALSAEKDPVSLSHIQMERTLASSDYAPPDTAILAEQRDQRLKELKMEAVLKEIIVYFFFLLVIFFISYQQRDQASYDFYTNIGNIFLNGYDSIVTVPDYWNWLQTSFLPAFYVTTYANGTDIKKWQDKSCIADLETRRLGVAMIRQHRVKENTCQIQDMMKELIKHCRDAYSWTDDDTKDYLPGWTVPTDDQREDLEDAEGPFVYQSSFKLKNAPYWGTLTTYKGGGYVLLTKREMRRTQKVVQEAKDNDWLDQRTRAVFLEFTVYNPNINLFASVILLTEFLTTGGATSRADIKIFRLLSYIGGWGLVVLLFEVTYACFTLYFFIRCVRMVKKQRLAYFVNFWNILEFILLCFAVSCIVLYTFKHILTDVAMSALKDRTSDGFVNFQSVALYDEMYCYVMSAVVYMATIQFLKLLQFNKKMSMLGDTVKLATKDLKVFSIAFVLYFMAFVITGYLLFGQVLTTYNNIIGSAETMFAFALGTFDFQGMTDAQPILGPIFFFLYIMVVYIGLMSIFLTIIGDSFTQVKENVALRSNEYEIVDFMWTRFKGLMGFT